MKLHERLDRLRQTAGHKIDTAAAVDEEGGPGMLAPSSPPERSEARLRRIARRRSPSMRQYKRASPARLAALLGAVEVAPGLLLKQYTYTGQADACIDPAALPEMARIAQRNWVYIDTETTGLSGGVGTLAFMIGMARFVAVDRVEVRQYTLCGFAAEAEMLRRATEWIGTDAVLVSYNGKCFDLPLLQSRMALSRVHNALAELPQLDLMYTVRRAYQQFWPDCRLQTAERLLLGLTRQGDMPGAEAPAAWRRWLCGSDDHGLQGVLRHNALDVESLVRLHHRLARVYAGGGDHPVDYTAIGRAWWQVDRRHEAVRIWEDAGDRLCERGRLLLASAYRRRHDWPRAVAIWQQLHSAGNRQASLELAKFHEHRQRDYRTALSYAERSEDPGREWRCARLRDRLDCNRTGDPVGAVQLPLLTGLDANSMK
jgi:uncharacterized protein YprB with RNaseH-like and TPR domain